MAKRQSSEKYERLDSYARSKGLASAYLRGAIYALEIELPIIGGGYVVDGKARAKLDPVAKRILDGITANPLGMNRRGSRSRKKTETAVAV